MAGVARVLSIWCDEVVTETGGVHSLRKEGFVMTSGAVATAEEDSGSRVCFIDEAGDLHKAVSTRVLGEGFAGYIDLVCADGTRGYSVPHDPPGKRMAYSWQWPGE